MKWWIYAVAAIVTAVGMYPITDFSKGEEVVGFLVVTLAGCALFGFVGNCLWWRGWKR